MKFCTKKMFINLFLIIYFVLGLLLVADVNCAVSGLIRPIELVEEWGCYDTEFRLTCGNLATKVVILDATFTPNCTELDPDCSVIDGKRLLFRLYTSTKKHPHMEETQAGRHFLQALRKSNDDFYLDDDPGDDVESFLNPKEKKVSLKASLEMLIVKYLRKVSPEDNEDIEESLRPRRNLFNASTVFSDSDHLVSVNYTEIEELDGDHNETVKLIDDRVDYTNIDQDDGNFERGSKFDRFMLGSRNISVNESDRDYEEERRNRILYGEKSVCNDRKRRISQLDRFELDKSLEDHADDEYTIRAALNKRCAGKNHCSFIFGIDHPFALVWNSGMVRIKYICMDEFRVNPYCAENLVIGNEMELQKRTKSASQYRRKGEPIAEARIQQDQSYHQFTNIKILKPAVDEKTEQEIAEEKEREREKKRKQRIYSQDFSVLKILPNDIDDFNSIEQIGDEFYFKKDDSIVVTDNPSSAATATRKHHHHQHHQHREGQNRDISHGIDLGGNKPSKINDRLANVDGNYIDDKINGSLTKSTTFTTNVPIVRMTPTMRRMRFRTTSTPMLISSRIPVRTFSSFFTIPPPLHYGEEKKETEEPPPFWENEITLPDNTMQHRTSSGYQLSKIQSTQSTFRNEVNERINENDVTDGGGIHGHSGPNDRQTTLEYIKSTAESIENNSENKIEIENDVNGEDGFSVSSTKSNVDFDNSIESIGSGMKNNFRNEKTVINNAGRIDQDDNSYEYDNDDDDYYDEVYEDGDDWYTSQKRKKYKSIQRTSLRKPLVHGFAMTPGYPKYYIGESECNWTILAPRDQRIRLTFLDISMRGGPICRDYVQVIDLERNLSLFNSCSEISKPVQVLSKSSRIQVKVITTTHVVYPKRGILIHYTALGCLTPPTPLHAQLVERKDQTAEYKCDPFYVFPDTAVSSRILKCTPRHTWDNILPDCIEQKAVEGSGLVQHFDHNKKEASVMDSLNVNKTDTVNDIVIPSILIAGLFIVNAIVFLVIMRYRNKRKRLEYERSELADL